MKLWTYHPSNFRLDDPNVKIDPTKGMYWNDESLQYQKVLPKLQQLLGTDQFLWCCTIPDCFDRMTEDDDLVEWELVVPIAEILSFHSVPVWEDIVHGRGCAWDSLVIGDLTEQEAGKKEVGAWLRFPLKPDSIERFGHLYPLYPKSMRDRQGNNRAS